MKSELKRPFWLVLLAGVCVYVIASMLRRYVFAQSLTGMLSEIFLFLILLAPGAVVGYLRPRRVLELGFVAGFVSDIAYRVCDLLSTAILVDAPLGTIPVSSFMMGTLKGALPVGVLGAAGGALGYVLRVRRNGILSAPEGAS